MAFIFATAPFVIKNGKIDSKVCEARRWFKERLHQNEKLGNRHSFKKKKRRPKK
jgi:hypothetical protein